MVIKDVFDSFSLANDLIIITHLSFLGSPGLENLVELEVLSLAGNTFNHVKSIQGK